MSDTPRFRNLDDKEQLFVEEALIKIVESRYGKYEREYQEEKASELVPLENIKILPKNFEDFPHIMQGIKPYQTDVSKTVREMLGSLCRKGEISVSSGMYRLSTEGGIYKHLTEKLVSTQ